MFGCHSALVQSEHLAPAPLYLPWLDDEQSEHKAVIEDVLEPGKQWRVRYKASFWKACSTKAGIQFRPKDTVCVVGRQNLTLIIQAL